MKHFRFAKPRPHRLMDDAPARPPRAKAYESAPFLNQRRRITHLWPELRQLGLETHIAELAVQGYTVVPTEKLVNGMRLVSGRPSATAPVLYTAP